MTTVSSAHERFRTGVRAGIGFGAAAFVVGISFGVVAQPVMGSVAPIVMSAFVFAGASQFGATSVLLSGGGALTAIATGAMLNARFLPMGVAAAAALRGGRLRRALEGQAIVDASWAFAARGGGGFDREAMLGATLPQYPAGGSGPSSESCSATRWATRRRSASTRSSPPSSSACSPPSWAGRAPCRWCCSPERSRWG
jgi:predicted branched-subunit amino acid permease